MRLLVVMPLGELHGGAERILLNFVRQVDRTRIVPSFVFFEDGELRREVEALGLRAHVLRPDLVRRPRIVLFPPRLARVVRRERPDLVLSWLIEAQPYAGLATVLSGTRARIAWWQANMPRADLYERVATALPGRTVFAYSHATAAAQARIWPHRRTIAVHPGIDPPDPAGDDALRALRERHGLPPGKPVVGIVGRLQRWKGQHHFIEAVAEVRARGHDVHGLVVGGNAYDLEPDYEPRLHELASELGIADALTFTGQVDEGALYMQLMDVVVNASAVEPFGIVLLEAMALGRPVVAVDAAGPAEIVEPGESGLLVPRAEPRHFADAIERLVADPDERARIADGGRRRFERFTTHRMVDTLTSALEDVAGRRAPAGAR